MVQKGSITVDGVSLTVAEIASDALLGRAHPAHARTPRRSGRATPGSVVNLEDDFVAKYVERLIHDPRSPAVHASGSSPGGDH